MKRFTAMLLTLVCLFSFASLGALAEDRPTVSYFAYWCGALEPNGYVETYMQDKLNMEIEVRKVNHTDKEDCLLYTSGLGTAELLCRLYDILMDCPIISQHTCRFYGR